MSKLTTFWRTMTRRGRNTTALAALEREDTIDARVDRVGASLDSLARFEPTPGFVERVMARVTLPPYVPLHLQIGAALRRHWGLALAGVAGALAGVAVTVAWSARYPEATPVAIGVFAIRRIGELAWNGVLSAGRFLYESGLVGVLEGIAEGLTTTDALLALATVSLVGIGSFAVLLRLVEKPHDMLETSAAR